MPFLNNSIVWWLNCFWPLPIPVRNSSSTFLEKVLVAPNARGYIENLPMSMKNSMLVVDAGGYLPLAAGAFGVIKLQALQQRLEKMQKDLKTPPKITLLIPSAMAQSLGWRNGEQVNSYLISVVSDSPLNLTPSDLREDSLPNFWWVQRTTLAVPLILGQMAIFSIALVVFGIPILLLGLCALFVAGLLVAVSWNLIKGHGIIKGILIGLVAGSLTGFVILYILGQIDFAWKIAAGLLLCSTWMGCIYEGVRP